MANQVATDGASANPRLGARSLAWAGNLLAVAIFLPAALHPALSASHSAGASDALIFSGVALVAFLLATALLNQALLRGRLRAEIRRNNLAAGLIAAAHAVATGNVAAHCFAADSLVNLPVGAVFFGVAEIALVVLSLLFRALTAYADDQEIMGENIAAAISYAGLLVALSLVVGHAADGAFVGWIPALRSFGLFLLCALLLYPVRQVIVARLLLGLPITWRGGALDRAIAQERSWLVSCAEAAGYLAAAFLLTGLT
jgi:uncharacterized membrane protein YjfL (UPF0719 family)